MAALEPAWFCRVPGDAERLVFDPLIVDHVMYVAGVKGVVVALDAATGKELWSSTEQATERGITYWESADRTDRRLILTARNGIRELDATTGRLITSFGRNGFVDMPGPAVRAGWAGRTTVPDASSRTSSSSGSNVGEGYQ